MIGSSRKRSLRVVRGGQGFDCKWGSTPNQVILTRAITLILRQAPNTRPEHRQSVDRRRVFLAI